MYFRFFNYVYDHFFSSCCCYMAALTNLSVFWDTFSGIQDGFGPMVWISAWCRCLNWCSRHFFCNFWAVFVFFWTLSFWIFWILCGIFFVCSILLKRLTISAHFLNLAWNQKNSYKSCPVWYAIWDYHIKCGS